MRWRFFIDGSVAGLWTKVPAVLGVDKLYRLVIDVLEVVDPSVRLWRCLGTIS